MEKKVTEEDAREVLAKAHPDAIIESAPRESIKDYSEEIDTILIHLGHPGAFVTDESLVWDFCFIWGREKLEEDTERVNLLSEALGFEVICDDLLLDVALRMRQGQAGRR